MAEVATQPATVVRRHLPSTRRLPGRRPRPYRLRPRRRYRRHLRRRSPSRQSSPPSTAPSGLREVHIDPVRARAMYIVSPRRALPVIILVLLSVLRGGWLYTSSYQSLGKLRVLRGVSRTEKLGYLQPPLLPVPRRRQHAITAFATRLPPARSRRPRRADHGT